MTERNNSGRYLPDGKLNVAGRWKSPGPGKYMPPSTIGYLNHDPTIDRRPAFSIGSKYRDMTKESQSPGPIYSVNPKVFRNGRASSACPHIISRPKGYSLYVGPGPADYSPERIKSSAPAFTIGVKHKHLELPVHPVGPNQYSLPNTIGNNNYCTFAKTAPKFSISSRNKFMSTTFGLEDNTNHSLYLLNIEKVKSASPKWTITGRNYAPESNSGQIPGPNKYKLESVKVNLKTPPKFSFGIRHSELCETY